MGIGSCSSKQRYNEDCSVPARAVKARLRRVVVGYASHLLLAVQMHFDDIDKAICPSPTCIYILCCRIATPNNMESSFTTAEVDHVVLDVVETVPAAVDTVNRDGGQSGALSTLRDFLGTSAESMPIQELSPRSQYACAGCHQLKKSVRISLIPVCSTANGCHKCSKDLPSCTRCAKGPFACVYSSTRPFGPKTLCLPCDECRTRQKIVRGSHS